MSDGLRRDSFAGRVSSGELKILALARCREAVLEHRCRVGSRTAREKVIGESNLTYALMRSSSGGSED